MRTLALFFSILLLLGSASGADPEGASRWGHYGGPHSLGAYSLDRKMSVKSFLTMFGAVHSGQDIYCFEDKEHSTYLYATKSESASTIDGVTLSTFPNCEGIPIHESQINPTTWRTPEGIGLASSAEEVLSAYGKPLFVDKLEGDASRGIIARRGTGAQKYISVGDSGYLYSCLLNAKQGCSDDLRVTRVGFNKGKVIWIQISNSE